MISGPRSPGPRMQPVVELANAWIRQSGYPVVSVTLEDNRRPVLAGALLLRAWR